MMNWALGIVPLWLALALVLSCCCLTSSEVITDHVVARAARLAKNRTAKRGGRLIDKKNINRYVNSYFFVIIFRP
jgi:hypothetical protein